MVGEGGESREAGGDGYESSGNTSPYFGIEIDVGADGGVTLTCGALPWTCGGGGGKAKEGPLVWCRGERCAAVDIPRARP